VRGHRTYPLRTNSVRAIVAGHASSPSLRYWRSPAVFSVLDNQEPPDDIGRKRALLGSAAVQLEPGIGNEQLTQRLVVITQPAEELDRGTLEIALRVVPVEWWERRLGATVPLELRSRRQR
jgi:hypothetical protein